MDFHTFQMLRSACRGDLAQYIDTSNAETLLKLNLALHGDLAKLKWEADQAESLYACDDLTLRERAAAHLLAVACNHRAIAWHREPEPPNGREQAKPLSPEQSAVLWTQTREAVTAYAVHLPEREAEWLRAEVDEKPSKNSAGQGETECSKAVEPPNFLGPNRMKKAALIAELEHVWPTIRTDISEASRNELKAAAHDGKHGMWDRDKARAWAVSRGKIKDGVLHVGVSTPWPGITRHKLRS